MSFARTDWLKFFPDGVEIVLSYHDDGVWDGHGAAIARLPSPTSFTREVYYAREYVYGSVGSPAEDMSELLGPVDTLPAALQLVTERAREQLVPAKPNGS